MGVNGPWVAFLELQAGSSVGHFTGSQWHVQIDGPMQSQGLGGG